MPFGHEPFDYAQGPELVEWSNGASSQPVLPLPLSSAPRYHSLFTISAGGGSAFGGHDSPLLCFRVLLWLSPPSPPFDRQSAILSSKKINFYALSVVHVLLVATCWIQTYYDTASLRHRLVPLDIRKISWVMHSISCYNLGGAIGAVPSRCPLLAARNAQ
jgi:hypothetical protein